MNLVVQNPYRILGIVNPISHKELLKAESNLKTFIEFKKPIDFSTDLIEIFPLIELTHYLNPKEYASPREWLDLNKTNYQRPE